MREVAHFPPACVSPSETKSTYRAKGRGLPRTYCYFPFSGFARLILSLHISFAHHHHQLSLFEMWFLWSQKPLMTSHFCVMNSNRLRLIFKNLYYLAPTDLVTPTQVFHPVKQVCSLFLEYYTEILDFIICSPCCHALRMPSFSPLHLGKTLTIMLTSYLFHTAFSDHSWLNSNKLGSWLFLHLPEFEDFWWEWISGKKAKFLQKVEFFHINPFYFSEESCLLNFF